MIALLSLILAAQAAATSAVPPPQEAVEPDPKSMSRAEVREHNAGLARNDPFYIRCERQEEIGSLVARKTVCRTNRQWAALDKANEGQIRGIADDVRSRSASSGN
jgi:hypothetical protein